METRVERIAGQDRKITQEDIQRLEALDSNGDLSIAREILPPDFFRQLEKGKWFGISEGSALGRSGYIEKLNQIGARYEQDRAMVERRSTQDLENINFGGQDSVPIIPETQNQFTRTLRLTSPSMQGPDIQLLQEKLTALGYDTQGIDGIFGRNTQKALISYQQQKLGLRGDGVMDFDGFTMQSFLVGNTDTSPIPERASMTPEPSQEERDIRGREDIKTALQTNGIEDPEIISRVEKSLVTLSSGMFGVKGSGSFIAPNIVLTAEHVIRDLDTMEYRNMILHDAQGNRYDIVKMYIDPSNNDIAFIETKQSSENYLPLATGNVENRVNQEGVLLGFHQNRPRFQRTNHTPRMQNTESRIHSPEDGGKDFGYFDALPGDSGGPIILSDGTIGGMAIARFDQENQGTIYQTAPYIYTLYNKIL